MSCLPEVTSLKVADGHVLILATDGLWDVLTEEAACNLLEKSIESGHMERSSQDLVDEAIRLGSKDNVLVLCIFL